MPLGFLGGGMEGCYRLGIGAANDHVGSQTGSTSARGNMKPTLLSTHHERE